MRVEIKVVITLPGEDRPERREDTLRIVYEAMALSADVYGMFSGYDKKLCEEITLHCDGNERRIKL